MTDKQVIKDFVKMMERDSRIHEKELQDCRQDIVNLHFGELEAYRGVMMTESYQALKALVDKPAMEEGYCVCKCCGVDTWDKKCGITRELLCTDCNLPAPDTFNLRVLDACCLSIRTSNRLKLWLNDGISHYGQWYINPPSTLSELKRLNEERKISKFMTGFGGKSEKELKEFLSGWEAIIPEPTEKKKEPQKQTLYNYATKYAIDKKTCPQSLINIISEYLELNK